MFLGVIRAATTVNSCVAYFTRLMATADAKI